MNHKVCKISLDKIENITANITTTSVNHLSIKKVVQNRQKIKLCYFITPEKVYSGSLKEEPIYNFPLLLEKNGELWKEANHFLLDLIITFNNSRFIIDRKASHLRDYKNWLDEIEAGLFDFSHRRIIHRPTYRYFIELLETGISAGNINNRISTIYNFYKFISRIPKYNLDLKRVDQVTKSFITFKNEHGASIFKQIEKRKLKAKVKRKIHTEIGMVNDEGEDLRPLNNTQLDELIIAIKGEKYAVDEQLFFETALDIGARKQSILTLRMGHVRSFVKENLMTNGCYRVEAGPGTGIDTKNGKPHVFYFPEHLAEKIKIYAFSELAIKRRKIFVGKFGENLLNDDEMYVYIAARGDCRYMAKNDPRYKKTKSPPIGGSIQTIINKLFRYSLSDNFPEDYTFHWNRATFALRYYNYLLPLFEKKIITYKDMISFICDALGHDDPKTTEDYLKLFTNSNELMKIQGAWEEQFFGRTTIQEYEKRVDENENEDED